MSVRKRTWITPKGEHREAWQADYTGVDGRRHSRTFDRKKDADAFISEARVEVRKGIHTADYDSCTLAEASGKWLETCVERGLERTSIRNYEIVSRLHICPFIGHIKLPRLTAPTVREFEAGLLANGRTPKQTRVAMACLSFLLSDAMERGLISHNVLRELGSRRKGGNRIARRRAGRLEVGVNIPSREEIKAIVPSLRGFWRPLIITAAFTGLRASELRGLRWADIDFERRELHVRQRADCFKTIGPPKTLAGVRTVPLIPIVINALRNHKLQRGQTHAEIRLMPYNKRGEAIVTLARENPGISEQRIATGLKCSTSTVHKFLSIARRADTRPPEATEERSPRRSELVFTSTGQPVSTLGAGQWSSGKPRGGGRWPGGGVLSLGVIIESGWQPAQVAAGVVKANGTAKYGGLHCLRHFYASWCINSIADGGQGLSAKVLQTRLGHASIGITLDVYSHLFPVDDEFERGAAAEKALLG